MIATMVSAVGIGGRSMIVHFSLVVVFGAIAASGLTLQALQSFFG